MAPSPMGETASIPPAVFEQPSPDDEIFITGIAGYFPNCRTIKDLEENLFNKVDMISGDDRRWRKIHPEIPQRTGKIYDLEKFDAPFFGVNYKDAHSTDPAGRLLMERIFECLIDAGVNPSEMNNSSTGIYVGICFCESDTHWVYCKGQCNDNGILGTSKSMLANRISQWLGLKGPSYTIDTACSSSLYALEDAFKAIKGGLCDSAIVCGVNLCLHHCTSLIFSRLGVLSIDGNCKCFDSRGNGYVRSESVVACYLQKAKDSRRVHAKIVHAKTNCDGYKVEGITYPSGQMQKLLLDQFYSECGVSPSSIEYVEAHSTGTYVGDPEEVSAIAEVFYKGRNEPLLIGSVKSNLGHAEASSGMNSIAKAIIAYNTGFIPPNVNYINPRADCPSIVDGRLKVVTEKQAWGRGLLALSSFGFGGGNAHVLLDNFSKPKVNNGLPTDPIPRLVCVSGRTESAVARILDDLESRPVDAEEVRLWHSIFERDIPGHNYRGYVLLGSTPSQTIRLHRDIISIPDVHTQSQILFKYTDLGTHWPVIAKKLLILPVFSAAIQRCSLALKENHLDLFQLFDDDAKRSNFGVVGATSVYIGLTDVLHSIGIKPDFIISANAGELCSAYADGCITAEQTILAAYYIDLHLKNMLLNKSIIKVYMEYKRVLENCPSSVRLEYDDNQNYSIVIGPALDVKKFADILTARNIQVEYPGFFSPEFLKYYLKNGGINQLLSCINNALPPVMNRSKRWVSQSNELTFTPPADDVIVIEIGLHEELPHSKGDKKDISFIPLCKESADHVPFILTTIGRLYQLGVNLRLAHLYPEVAFPVSQGTPFLSHLIEWEHFDNWHIMKNTYIGVSKLSYGFRKVRIDVSDQEHEYITGHTIDGRVIFPATGYLVLVWETLAQMLGRLYHEMSVVFEDVSLHKATHIPKDGVVHFDITLSKGNGKFEISENNMSVVTGIIHVQEDDENDEENVFVKNSDEMCNVIMNTKDFYKELNIRGYEYKGQFRGVRSCSVDGTRGQVAWNNNWVTFLDTLLQTNIVAQDTRNLYVPTRIEKLYINAAKHNKLIPMLEIEKNSEDLVEFENFPNIEMSRAGGAVIRGLHVTAINKKPPKGIPVHEKNIFIPNFCQEVLPIQDILRSDLQFIHENIQTYKYKCIELIDEEYESNDLEPIIDKVGDVLADLPLVHAEMLIISKKSLEMPSNVTVSYKKISSETNNTLFIGANLLKRQDILQEALATLKTECFVLSRESEIPNIMEYSNKYDILTTHSTGTDFITLIREKNKSKPTKYLQIKTKDLTFAWIDEVKKELKEGQKLVLYSENEPLNGLLGLVNCVRKEPGGEMVYGLLISDSSAPSFNPDCKFYKEHLDKNLAINVLKAGQWGTYRHLLLEDLGTIPAAHAYVNTATIGDIGSLRWWEGKYSESQIPSDPNICLIEVYCAALNFRDAMIALGRVTVDAVARGRLNQDCVQGLEFAGRTANGTRVMGFGKKCIANVVECDTTGRSLLWPILNEWTFEEAATIPVVYTTVYAALVLIGKMRRGESILIHAGSGGVGQAAISVALHHGLEVFTTVGTPAKRAFIKKLFPQLKDSHIGNSRDTSFEQMIQRETNGQGVDLVLNSLAEYILQATVKCLRQGGRFLEIGKYDITANTQLEMCFLQKEISFHSIMLDYIADKESAQLRRDLQQLVLRGIENGAVRPLTYCLFEKHEIETAYRYMTAGKHIGKIVIRIREDEERGSNLKPTSMLINAVPRYMCDETQVYVLVGGLGGFGLELADWLVLRGARKLLISSRRGVSNGYQALRIRIWKSYGVKVKISTTDVTTESGCEEMLKIAAAMGPVRAVFNLAVVLNDAVFQNQTPDTFRNSFGPKALTTINLDKLTRTICPELKDFVIFSSVSCGRGNAGQANYGFSNSVMERICEERKAAGLPGLAIQWGAIGDVGLVADMQEENIQLEIGGTLQQRIVSCLQALDKFLKQGSPIVSSIVVAEKRASNTGANSVVDAIASIIGISDLKTISKQVPLSEMGIDSVMAVEIKQTLERDYEIFLNAQEIRMLTFAKLLELSTSDAPAETLNSQPQITNNSEAVAMALGMLVKSFGDEKLASEPYIYLKSAVSDDDKENVIFLLPGLESCASTFETLCSKLNARTCVLQLGLDTEEDKLEHLVDRLYRNIKSQLHPGAPFVLLGYSFGSLPILGLADKLESEGHGGLIFCIDGSPEYLQTLSKFYMHTVDDAHLQNYIISNCVNTVYPNIDMHQTFIEKIDAIESFEDKIKCALNLIPAEIQYSEKFFISKAKVTYNRLKIVLNFNSSDIPVLDSPIVLVRPKKQAITMKSGEDYGLSKFTKGDVKVHCVDAIHSDINENADCANILNDTLLKFFADKGKKAMRPIGPR